MSDAITDSDATPVVQAENEQEQNGQQPAAAISDDTPSAQEQSETAPVGTDLSSPRPLSPDDGQDGRDTPVLAGAADGFDTSISPDGGQDGRDILIFPHDGQDGRDTLVSLHDGQDGRDKSVPTGIDGTNSPDEKKPVKGVGPETEPVRAIPTMPKKLRPRSKRRTWFILGMVAILLLGVAIPAAYAVNYGLNAYSTYKTLETEAHGGVQHLLNIKTIFTGVKAHPTGFLDENKLHLSQKELTAAHQDFQQLQYTIDHASVIQTVTNYFPQYRQQVATARAASQIGMDVSTIGTKLVQTALTLAPSLHGSLLTSSSKPLVTPAMLTLIGNTIDYMLPLLNDIQAQSRNLSLNSLPVSASQRDEFSQLLQLLPQTTSDLQQARQLLGAAGWLLGVDHPRDFLVQTMDRAELRPTGGFTGQYGTLDINAGRVAPFTLHDISFLEYVDNSPTQGQLAPAQYRSWWPFANWGLRDSNLSADFPTSAQINMNLYQHETGHTVDGVILFTPILIEHVLSVIGPVQISAYHETITAQNLEDRLHYYQQDNAGIRKEEIVSGVQDPSSARKLFTSLVAKTLLDQVRHAPPDELLAIGREALHDLKTKDLQIYVNNAQVEGLLAHYGDAAQIDTSTTHDGLYVVQANISASKASQYVRTIMHDTVTLDAHGGATHLMQLRLVYNQIATVYGYDTYSDYVRVYVPPQSKLLYSDGFDTGTPLCGGPAVACPQSDVYPKDELLCPAGQYQPGAAAPSLTDSNGGNWHPLDTVGPVTSTTSDQPGRAMYAGLVVVPKNCTMTVTLSWYVPPTAQMSQHPYSLLVQRQAGTFPEVDVTILPAPAVCGTLRTQGMHFDGLITEDTMFTPKQFSPSSKTSTNCYPQPGV